MLKENLFDSIVRFVKEFNYVPSRKNRSLITYIVNHYRDCFHEEMTIPPIPVKVEESNLKVEKPKPIEEEEVKEKQKTPELFTSGGVTLEADPNGSGFICTVTHPGDSTNEQLIARYNELRYVLLPPRLLLNYMTDLDFEFKTRFNKSPMRRDHKDRLCGWKGKIQYLSEIEDYIFIEEN